MTDKEAMQMALETLDNMIKVDWREWDEFASVEDFVRWAKSRASFTAEALRARLAQPESDPVAWWHDKGDVVDLNVSGHGTPLYFAPPQREWVGLTHEEHMEILTRDLTAPSRIAVAEAKLKEKNG